MSDLFIEEVPDAFVDRVFETMRRASWHTVLTKRADRMRAYVERLSRAGVVLERDQPNTWLGTSVESQEHVARAEAIRALPSRVRFLSCEPLLGPLDLGAVLEAERAINWVIVGGESGHGARPMERAWVEGIREQCARASVPFFFKQWGGRNKSRTARLLDGRTWDEQPAVVGQRVTASPPPSGLAS